MTESTKGLLEFLQLSPTCFHAAETIESCLRENGYKQLQESQPWELEAGGKYYVTRNRSSILSFRIPSRLPQAIAIPQPSKSKKTRKRM